MTNDYCELLIVFEIVLLLTVSEEPIFIAQTAVSASMVPIGHNQLTMLNSSTMALSRPQHAVSDACRGDSAVYNNSMQLQQSPVWGVEGRGQLGGRQLQGSPAGGEQGREVGHHSWFPGILLTADALQPACKGYSVNF